MSDTEASSSEPPPASHTVTSSVQLKLPPYWPSDPQIWFAQVEAQFSTRGITSQRTRFDYVISSLAPEVAHEVRDLLLKPPAERQYDTLKKLSSNVPHYLNSDDFNNSSVPKNSAIASLLNYCVVFNNC